MEKNFFAVLISTLGRFDRANKKKSVIYTLSELVILSLPLPSMHMARKIHIAFLGAELSLCCMPTQ